MEIIESSLETTTVTSSSSNSTANIDKNLTVIPDTPVEEEIKKYEESNNKNDMKLFSNIIYYIINTNNSDIDKLLDENGAKQDKYLGDFLTHVICDEFSMDNPECYEAKDVFELKIVKSDWVLKSLYSNSLLPLEAFSHDDQNNLFKDINLININMPVDLSKEIMATLNFYGGKCINISELNEESILKSGATHAISIKYDDLTQKLDNRSIKLITPEWIMESIDRNELLNEINYNPKYLLNSCENLNDLVNAYHEKKKILEDEENRKEISVEKEQSNFNSNNNKKVDILENVQTQIILDDFNNNNSTNKLTESPSNYQQASIAIDNHNTTNNNNQACLTPTKQKSKRSSKSNQISSNTTSTLNDMNEIFQSVISGASTNPTNDGNENIKTNSTNKMSVYLDMIKPTQQNYPKFPTTQCIFDEDSTSQDDNETNYVVQENSHLIQFDSCLLGCVFHLKPCETYFTLDCLNEWQKVIERFGGKCLSEYSNGNTIKAINQQQEITHVLCPNRLSETYRKAMEERKRIVTPYWLEDVLQEQKLRPPWLAYHFPSPYEFREGPLTNHVISLHGFTPKEKLILKTLIWLLNGKYSSHLSNINSFLISKNNEGIKVEKAKQWGINIVNGIWLSELYLGNLNCLIHPLNEKYLKLDISNHFHFDSGYVTEFMDQWKQLIKLPIEKIKEQANSSNNNINNQKQRSPLKRYNRSLSGSPTPNELSSKISKLDETLNETEGTTSSISWIKPQSKIPIVLFTGFDTNELQQYQRDVIGLGGILAKQLNQTTHLIVDRIERTAKLLKTISIVDHIIHIKWLLDSKLNGKFLDPMLYQIKDDRFEKHYSCCLKESLLRAKMNKPLFSGLYFYLSPSVRPSYSDLEEMIKSAGGTVLKDVPTMQMFMEPYKDVEHDRRTGLTSKYILIGSQNDLCILKPFIEKKIPIYHEELILSGLLRQRLDSQIYRLNAQ